MFGVRPVLDCSCKESPYKTKNELNRDAHKMKTVRATSRQLCTFYFTPLDPNDIGGGSKTSKWKCNKCCKSKLKSGGWTNLLNHAQCCVGSKYRTNYESLHCNEERNKTTIKSFVIQVSEAELHTYKWVEWIVMKNQPLSMVDCPLTRAGMQYEETTSKLLRRHILALHTEMQTTIMKKLPDKFSIIFDGWSEGTVHYIGVSAAYVTEMDSSEVVAHTLLSMRPLLADDIVGMTASDHLQHLSKMLETYEKTLENIVCLVGDNCSVNQSMSRILKVPLLGCGSHKFNLAVRKWITNQPHLVKIIATVAGVMKKASTLKASAELRKLTKLHTVKENDTRWSSTFAMIERFIRIKGLLEKVVVLKPLMTTIHDDDQLAQAFVHLKQFNQITIMLQKEGITFLRVREIFDTILEDYPELDGHIGAEAEIIVNVAFEKAVMKIAKGHLLSEDERELVKGLLRPVHPNGSTAGSFDGVATSGVEDECSYAQKIEARLKRRKINNDDIASQYVNLDLLAGTSVACERLFSAAKHILTDTRKSTSPAVFEAILMLKVNRSEWDVNTMGRAMGRTTGTSFEAAIDGTIRVDPPVVVDVDPDLFYSTDY